jgi:two-component system chemotaxis response regulator CheB
MINVLIVDDSRVSRELLGHILTSDPDIRVIGHAVDGEEALAFVAKEKPDVITMDISMPKLDGIGATRKIMETRPLPIIIVSGLWNPAEVATTFRAMEAGAVALVEKPGGPGSPKAKEQASSLIQTVKNMAEVRVIRRRAKRDGDPAPPLPIPTHPASAEAKPGNSSIVAVAVSTGGPPVLRTLLLGLPPNFGAPILVVQHMAPGFLPGLAEWLNSCGCSVEIAKHGRVPKPGWTYLAPDDYQMGLDPGGAICLSLAPPEHGLRPSASYLFRSVTEVFGSRAIGVVLTGMGRDGADDLKRMRDAGAVTFAQDQESSVVHGMPGAAINLGAAIHVLPPEKIAVALGQLVRPRLL